MMWFRWVELEQLSFCRGARLENWINRWKPYKYDFKRMKLDKNWIRINYPWKPLQAAICKTWIWRTHEYANYVNFVFICIVNLWPNTHGSGLSCINFHKKEKITFLYFWGPTSSEYFSFSKYGFEAAFLDTKIRLGGWYVYRLGQGWQDDTFSGNFLDFLFHTDSDGVADKAGLRR